MDLSIIIPTLNAEGCFSSLLEAVKRQTIPAKEIIVIDSFSGDRTVEVAQEFGCRIKVIPKSQFTHGGSRNLGVQLAREDLLVFMTQDALPVDTYFLEELTRPIREGQTVAAYARQIPYPDANPLEVFGRMFNYPEKSHIKTIEDVSRMGIKGFFFSNVASAIHRKAMKIVGGFPDQVIMMEDMVLCAKLLQAGYAVGYQARARVYHSHNYNLNQVFKRYFDIGVFTVQAEEFLQAAKAGGEGIRFIVRQLEWLLGQGKSIWIPRSLMESITKYAAYQLGRRSQFIPKKVKQKFSMHAFIWDGKA